jgi:hypothetical protein
VLWREEAWMKNHSDHYNRLFAMVALSFIAMYVFMYVMVDSIGNVYANINQFYMVAVMTAPMVIFELLLMSGMYTKKSMNTGIIVVSVILLIAAYSFTRNQTFVSDKQFLRSMIPHHGGAILMCGQAPLKDPEILALCKNIESSQQVEIDQMKAILARLK